MGNIYRIYFPVGTSAKYGSHLESTRNYCGLHLNIYIEYSQREGVSLGYVGS